MIKRLTFVVISVLLIGAFAASSYGQFPTRSSYDEEYSPASLAGLKKINVSTEVQVFIPLETLKTEITRDEAKTRMEALLKRAGIGYLSEAEAKVTPDAPVLHLLLVATKVGENSYSLVMQLDLLQKVLVDSRSKMPITASTWMDREISTNNNDSPRESILGSVDWMTFGFIKAYNRGNSKPVPKPGEFFRIVSPDEPTETEPRPKSMAWGPAVKGLQMAAWTSPIRNKVFLAIRNAGQSTIHYCDYVVGYFENVRMYARPEGTVEWKPVPLASSEWTSSIGVLLCGPHNTLRPGQEMPPNWSHLLEGTKINRMYTFTEDLTSYNFPTDWKGKVECKITQSLFGGSHKDSWEGNLESSVFRINLPFKT
jgi:hypothetical protein